VSLSFVEKRLSTRARDDAEAVARFRAEAELLRILGGRVTPRLIEAGDDERGPFLRMENVGLPTLGDRMHAALDPAFIDRAFLTALDVLRVLHEGEPRVVHADLSPSNLAVSDDGTRVVILDLGLAHWHGAPARDGAFRGTIAYAAPEVARGELPTPQSDWFSLAASFLHAATGEHPHEERSFAAALTAVAEIPLLTDEHRKLASRGPGHAAMIGCLAHEAAQRRTC
jgi:eukaryotic-like serine/threonine-protein kinase